MKPPQWRMILQNSPKVKPFLEGVFIKPPSLILGGFMEQPFS